MTRETNVIALSVCMLARLASQSPSCQVVLCLCICACVCLYIKCVFVPVVSTLPEEGRQQASDHAAATEEIQEPHHPGL